MRANTPGFVGERLVQARKSLGLSGASLAGLLGVSPTTISQYEKDRQSPRPEIMDCICSKLSIPRPFFLKPVADRGERKIVYRSFASATKAARDRAEIRFEWLREVSEYLGDYFDFPALNLPRVQVPADFRTLGHDAIEQAAGACRELWGFKDGPIADLSLALESNGIVVSRFEMGSEALDAFSEFLPTDRHPYVVLGTDKQNAFRSRFDAAHELGHIVLHSKVSARDFVQPSDFRMLEMQANRFAAAFLLPASSFLKSIWAPTLDAFRGQKETWRVSIKGMIVRSHQLGVIDEPQYTRMLINYGRRYRNGEPGDIGTEPEKPRLLSRSMGILIEERIKSREQILSDLAMNAHQVEELCGLPRGYFSGHMGEVIQLPVLKSRGRNDEAQAGSGEVIQLGVRRIAR